MKMLYLLYYVHIIEDEQQLLLSQSKANAFLVLVCGGSRCFLYIYISESALALSI